MAVGNPGEAGGGSPTSEARREALSGLATGIGQAFVHKTGSPLQEEVSYRIFNYRQSSKMVDDERI